VLQANAKSRPGLYSILRERSVAAEIERSTAGDAQDIQRGQASVASLRQYLADKAIGRLRNCRRHSRALLERLSFDGVDQAALG